MASPEFNQMLVNNAEFLKPFAITLTRDSDAAQDLYQETLYRALANKEKYNVGTNIKAWLYTIMRNIFINNYRRESRSRIISDETENQYYINTLARSIGNYGETSLGLKEIEQAMSEIDSSICVPFIMYFEGYKYHEIAKHLSIPLGTVKSRIFFARKELQRKIGRHS